jgi:uncharacterized protein
MAAEQGDPEAQFTLGLMYFNGTGVERDDVLAHMRFNLAAGQGNQDGVRARARAVARMRPDQISQAQRLAREWKPLAQR